MKRFKLFIISAIVAAAFILLTGCLSALYIPQVPWLSTFSFMFHVYAFGVGFSEGSWFFALIYYLLLWLALTFMFSGIAAFVKALRRS